MRRRSFLKALGALTAGSTLSLNPFKSAVPWVEKGPAELHVDYDWHHMAHRVGLTQRIGGEDYYAVQLTDCISDGTPAERAKLLDVLYGALQRRHDQLVLEAMGA